MSHFVSQGELAVQGSGVVQQDKGMHLGTSRISAAALALVLIDIDPAVFKAFLQNGLVFLAQRRQRIVHGLLGFSVGNAAVHFRHQRGIDIIEMQLANTQQLLAQTDIAMHLVHVLVNGFDQVVIHSRGNVGGIQGSIQSVVILSGIGKELQLLVLGIEQSGSGVLEPGKAVIEIFVSAAAQHPVLAFFQAHKGALGQRMPVSFPIHGIGERDIRIGEGAIDGIRSLGHLSCGSQQTFFLGRKGVCLPAAQIRQVTAVALQFRAGGIEALQSLLVDCHNLRSSKAGSCRQRHHSRHIFTGHSLGVGVPGIFIRAAEAIVAQPIRLYIHLLNLLQVLIQRLGAFCQAAFVGCHCGAGLLQGGQFLFPCLIGHKQVFNRPLVLSGNFASGRNFLYLFHNDILHFLSRKYTLVKSVSGCWNCCLFIIPQNAQNAMPLAFSLEI